MSQIQSKVDGAPVSFRDALTLLGIRPWTPGGIQAYKDAEAAKHRPNIWYYIEKPVITAFNIVGMLCAVIAFVGLCTIIGFTKDAIVALATGAQNSESSWGIAFALLILGAMFSCIAFVLSSYFYYGRSGFMVREPAYWLRLAADQYTGNAPERMGTLLKRIGTMFPGATFSVDDLRQDERSLDPVLWVHLEGEDDVAVLVWDTAGNIVLPN